MPSSTALLDRPTLASPVVAADARGSYDAGVSAATVDDLTLIEQDAVELERRRRRMVLALARVADRRDGEAAVGMPMRQHLTVVTKQARGAIAAMQTVADVIHDLPTILAAWQAGDVSFDQVKAVAYPAAKVGRDRRADLDGAFAANEFWTGWDPDAIEYEAERVLESLDPRTLEEREASQAGREYLYIQPTLDGQALTFTGRYEGLNAALFDSVLQAAAITPQATTDEAPPDRPRSRELAAGLLRVLTDWASGSAGTGGPRATIHLLIEEGDPGAPDVNTTTTGLKPRLSPSVVDVLSEDADVTVIQTRAGVPMSIDGRPGHAINAPDLLSDDSRHKLAMARDARCRAPGCHAPIRWTERHHLHHRSAGGSDDLTNLVSLCRRCHLRMVHAHDWTGALEPDGTVTWRRNGRTIRTLPRHHRRLRLPPPPRGPDGLPF